MTPAFKEWQTIVSALGAGNQTIILRKGGIHEGRQGFRPDIAGRFWLFPTRFHAQREKTKPAAAPYFSAAADPAPPSVSLQYLAERVQAWFVTDWAVVQALDALHLWTDATVRERFDWSRPPGIHVLLVRVYALNSPEELDVTAEMSGCKSWIGVPLDFPPALQPVLNDSAFATQAAAVRERLGSS